MGDWIASHQQDMKIRALEAQLREMREMIAELSRRISHFEAAHNEDYNDLDDDDDDYPYPFEALFW